LGNLCEGRKLHKEAIQYYEKAMELNPHFAKCYLNLGIAYANTGQFKKAIKIWKKSLNFTVDKNMVKAYIQKAQKLTTASYLSSP
jgi:tetratricopeptide (TPR) repeat protein